MKRTILIGAMLAMLTCPMVADEAEPAYISADAAWVVHFDVDAWGETKLEQAILDQHPEAIPKLEEFRATFGFDLREDLHGVTLYGTEGGAEISVADYVGEDALRIYTDVAGAPCDITPHVGKGEGHLGAIRDFVATIRGGDWTQHVGAVGLYRSQIIEACYRSAQERREVRLDEVRETPAPRMEVKRDVVVCN